MANPSQTPKQNLVRRYIIGKLFPACGKEPMPLNELAIARKFGVNRLTVRKVCADLVQDHSLITIPGRRGLFINPDYVMMRGARRFIGVIGSVRKLPLIEKSNFQILSAFDSAIRSLIVAIYELGVEEIMVVAHSNCGACHMSYDHFHHEMMARGVTEEKLDTIRKCGIDLDAWLEGFKDTPTSVRKTVETIKTHPLIPKDIVVRGFIIDSETGELEEMK